MLLFVNYAKVVFYFIYSFKNKSEYYKIGRKTIIERGGENQKANLLINGKLAFFVLDYPLG